MAIGRLLGVLVLASALAGPATAQDSAQSPAAARIAVVDIGYILENAEAAKKFRQALQKRQQSFQKQLNQGEQKVRQARQKLRQQQSVLAQDAIKKRQQKIQVQARRLQRQVQMMRRQIDRWRQQGLNRVRREVGRIARDLASEKDLALVLDSRQAIYAQDSLDLTQEVLKRFDKQVAEIKLPKQGSGSSASSGSAGSGASSGAGTGASGGSGGLQLNGGN